MSSSSQDIPLVTTPTTSTDYGAADDAYEDKHPPEEEDERHPVREVCDKVMDDVVSYISEYGLTKYSEEVKNKRAELSEAVNAYDVVIIAKKGCGFCERAKTALINQYDLIPFSQREIIGTDRAWRLAAGATLNLFDITFPQIIVRGVYVGGGDDLQSGIVRGDFPAWVCREKEICSPNSVIMWEPQLLEISTSPSLFKVATVPSTKSKWYSKFYLFNWHMYSNLVRYISLFHVFLFGILLVLFQPMKSNSTASAIAGVVFGVLIVDLILLVLLGPSPFSLSGVIGTYFGWKYKGNVTSSIPYKAVFAAYLLSMLPLILKNGESIHSGTALGVYIANIINSSVLVVFRF